MTSNGEAEPDSHSLSAFYEFLRRSYGDLKAPTRGFVSDVENRDPFAALRRELQGSFQLIDRTETNYEVCFAYGIKGVAHLSLWLSMVGPYSVLLRQPVLGEAPIDVVTKESIKDADELLIWETAESHGFRFLTMRELEMPMNINLWNRRFPPRLYAAYFLNEGIAPWRAVEGSTFDVFEDDDEAQ